MACGLLHPVPAGAAATAAALSPCFLSPAPRQSFPKEEQLNQFQRWKLPLNIEAFILQPSQLRQHQSAKSQRSRSLVGCSSSGSSAGVAAVSGPTDTSTTQSALSMTCCVDSVPGAPVVISGYWTGPDVDDGCGSVEAMLQRIV